jgi:hypothetical protein
MNKKNIPKLSDIEKKNVIFKLKQQSLENDKKLKLAYENFYKQMSKTINVNKVKDKVRDLEESLDGCTPSSDLLDKDYLSSLTKEQAQMALNFAAGVGVNVCTQKTDYSESLGEMKTYCQGKTGGDIKATTTGVEGRAYAEASCYNEASLGKLRKEALTTGCESLIVTFKNSVIAQQAITCAINQRKNITNTNVTNTQQINITIGPKGIMECGENFNSTQSITVNGKIELQLSVDDKIAIKNLMDASLTKDIDQSFEKVSENVDPALQELATANVENKTETENQIQNNTAVNNTFNEAIDQVSTEYLNTNIFNLEVYGILSGEKCNISQSVIFDLQLKKVFGSYTDAQFANSVSGGVKEVIKTRISEMTTYADRPPNPAVSVVDSVTTMVSDIAKSFGQFGSVIIIVVVLVAVLVLFFVSRFLNNLISGIKKPKISKQFFIFVALIFLLAGIFSIIAQNQANINNDNNDNNDKIQEGDVINLSEIDTTDGSQGYFVGIVFILVSVGIFTYIYISNKKENKEFINDLTQ